MGLRNFDTKYLMNQIIHRYLAIKDVGYRRGILNRRFFFFSNFSIQISYVFGVAIVSWVGTCLPVPEVFCCLAQRG